MRVAYVTLVDVAGTSGQNVYCRNIATALGHLDGVDLVLICPDPEEGVPDELAAVTADEYFLPKKRSRDIRWHLATQRPLLRALRRANEVSLDAVVSTLRPSLVVPPLFAHANGVSYRLLVEGNISSEVQNLVSTPFAKWVSDVVTVLNFVCSQRTYAVNDEVKEWITSLPLHRGDVEVLPHGVDANLCNGVDADRVRVRLGIPSESFVICYVGSFKSYHCLPPLVRATATLRAEGADLRLLLIGDGPRRDVITRLADDLGISDAVTTTGFVDPADVGQYLSVADACYGVIDPSRTGSPMKVYEYLACGRPVVVTEGPEFDFVKRTGAGVTLETVSTETVSDALAQLVDMPEEKRREMGADGREYLLEAGHTWEQFSRRLLRSR